MERSRPDRKSWSGFFASGENMLKLILILGTVLLGVIVPGGGMVFGQGYPNKPVRIVTTEPGGGGDFAARLIAPGLTSNLGQQVIADPRGGGVIAIEMVIKAPPDGHTLLLYGSNLWLLPFMRSHVPYDPVTDFATVTLATKAPNILVVHPSLPVKSVGELIALAKARPGELNYGTSGIGNSVHVAGELFKAMAGVNIVCIPYKGTAPVISDLLGGQVQLMFGVAAAVVPHARSGRLRALAVTSAQPSALVPGLPTVAAAGLPGYESVAILSIFAPANTPAMLVNRLNQEIVRVLNQADVKERFLATGVEVIGSTPEQLAATMKSEMARMGKVIRDAGIKTD